MASLLGKAIAIAALSVEPARPPVGTFDKKVLRERVKGWKPKA